MILSTLSPKEIKKFGLCRLGTDGEASGIPGYVYLSIEEAGNMGLCRVRQSRKSNEEQQEG
jgi:hypothetical protein